MRYVVLIRYLYSGFNTLFKRPEGRGIKPLNTNKEKPIIFSTLQVQAILDGRKTQTRRVVKPQPFLCKEGTLTFEINDKYGHGFRWGTIEHESKIKIGYILWVRETWTRRTYLKNGNVERCFTYKADVDPIYRKEMSWKPSIHMPARQRGYSLK